MFQILNFNIYLFIFFFFFFFFFFFWGGGGGGGVQKMKILGYEDYVNIFFLGSSQNWTSFRGHYFYAFFGTFLKSRYRMGIFFGC